jgi:chromosome segregation ATPase
MRKRILMAVALLCVCEPARCVARVQLQGPAQAAATDSKTMQSVLEEIRNLRRDLQTTATTVQRIQILLYRIRTQMEVVFDARGQHDRAQFQVQQLQQEQDAYIEQSKQWQDRLERAQDAAGQQQVEQQIADMKRWYEKTQESEGEIRAKEAETANTLRLELGKLAELQDQLERLDRKLDVMAARK